MLLFRKNKKKPTTTVHTKVDFDHLPRHVAIIMDGNGRWAKKRGMPRTAGHAAGAETFRTIATYCKDIGLDYLTVYAFSTENWKRPLHEAIQEMAQDHIKLQFFGDLTSLDPELYQLCQETRKISEGYDGFQVNVCLNYGGRDEIVRAARKFAQDCVEGKAKPEELTETSFASDLYSAGIPDPELIIRPSGEIRTSNFLLWQSAYSEYYFTDVLWPDFSPDELLNAIASYQGRSRRFGGV